MARRTHRLARSGDIHARVALGGESFTALAGGLQDVLRHLGGAPRHTAPTACGGVPQSEQGRGRGRDRVLGTHCGMEVTRNNRGVAHERGSVEGPHGHLEYRTADALALRCAADFWNLDACRRFAAEAVGWANAHRSRALEAVRATLRDLPAGRTADEEPINHSTRPCIAFGELRTGSAISGIVVADDELVPELPLMAPTRGGAKVERANFVDGDRGGDRCRLRRRGA